MNRPISRILVALSSLLTVLLVAGCADMPISGPVSQGTVQENDTTQGLQYYPAAPADGATPEEIVQGFLDAGTGTQDNYATAREYLTADAAARWRPQASVLVTNGQASMRTSQDTTITVSVPVTARVSERGVYTEQLSASTESLVFELKQVNGQWRIDVAPDCVVLLRQPFVDLYTSVPLTFFDAAKKYTTVDVRWFLNDEHFTSRLVYELLLGPADWLYPGEAVTTAFPSGTALLSQVSVVDGQATVNLSEQASTAANASDLSLMRLQLERSLTTVKGVNRVEMRVNDARIDAALPSAETVTTSPDVNSLPLVYRGGRLGYLNGKVLTLPSGADRVDAAMSQTVPIRGAVSASQDMAAFLTQDGTFAMRFTDDEATYIDSRGGQIEPALDNWGWIWTQSTTHPGLLVSHLDASGPQEIALPEGVARDFISDQVSRDGTKLAVLFNSPIGVTLAVMPIIRAEGKPVALGEPLLVEMPGAEDHGTDAAWIDGNSVALLVDTAEESTEVRLYRVGGELTSLGTIPGAIQVAGSNSLSGMRVIDRQGVVYAPRGTRWQASDTVVSFLLTQV